MLRAVLADKRHCRTTSPAASRTLVSAVRAHFDLPLHVHTHDNPGRSWPPTWRAWTRRCLLLGLARRRWLAVPARPRCSSIVAAAAHTAATAGESWTRC